ncbi:MAG: hypothetical protein J6N93_03935 [Clostridia bacterium]|nr:hypothetical protein [Clostridia bacterium]
MNDDLKEVAEEILSSAISDFCAEYEYFAYPVSLLSPSISDETQSFCTDGIKLYINGEYFLRKLSEGKQAKALFLHALSHVLLLHPFEKKGGENFDVAADIAVGYILDEMGMAFGERGQAAERKAVYKSIIKQYKVFNTRAAQFFLTDKSDAEIKKLSKLFTLCDHSVWKDDKNTETNFSMPSVGGEEELKKAESLWREIASGLISNELIAPTVSKVISASVGGKYDYRKFLKWFLSSNERIKSNEDEFDYIYYCLGLSRYGNMPLIENLEYRDDKNFSDVVIAIDTSGSTEGEPVARFLEETYSVVSQAMSAGEKLNFRIIECDSEIRDDITVKGDADFKERMASFELKGGGGTDFRPVFDRLIKDRRNGKKIKGLIYFTDGMGVYPTEEPPFKTCFALYGVDVWADKVPHFAYKIILGGEELI